MTSPQAPNNPFTQTAADARAQWKISQTRLNTARHAFNNGAVVRLREILNNKGALQNKLKASILEREQAEAEFKTAFEAAGFDKTAAVQKILNKKNDAIAICDELNKAIGQMQDEHQPIYLQADREAEEYGAAYAGAFNAYCLMSAMAQLEKHGPALAEAAAMLRMVPSKSSGYEADIGPNLGYSPAMNKLVLNARMDRVLGPLRNQAMATPADCEDVLDAVGPLDISPVDGRKHISPAERHMIAHNVIPSRLKN